MALSHGPAPPTPTDGDDKGSGSRQVPHSHASEDPRPVQALHAVELGLNHPVTGERIICEAPLPEAFDKLLTALRRRAA